MHRAFLETFPLIKRLFSPRLIFGLFGLLFFNSEGEGVNSQTKRPPQLMVSSGSFEVGAERGTRTHPPAKVADFKSRQAGGPGTGSQRNAELIARFVNNRRARGLNTTTCQYYLGYLSRFLLPNNWTRCSILETFTQSAG